MRVSRFVLTGFFLIYSSILSAEAKLFVEGGLHFGGDKLGTAIFAGGDTESIYAGEHISAAIGVVSGINDSFNMRASFGIKFDAVFASNGDVTFSRFPIDVIMITNNTEGLNFGLGLTYHMQPELSTSGAFWPGDVSYKDAFGAIAEMDYQLSERAYVGFKLTFVDYEADSVFFSETVNGNSFGVVIGASF